MAGERVLVWDLFTRTFHWLLAIAFLVEWLTQDDARYLDLHVFSGYAIGILIALRIVWGFVGTRWARFASFAYGVPSALRYLRDLLRGRHAHYVGHNPAGSWAIFALLLLGALTTLTGVMALGGEKQQGPLRGLLTYAQGDTVREAHEVLAWAMLAVVVAHLAGVAVSSVADAENLPGAMLRGRKRAPAGTQPVVPAANAAIVLLLILTGFGAWYFRGYLKATGQQPYLPFPGPVLATDAAWQRECGSCHLAFHPSLLPARSWQALLRQQDDHFGEDLALDARTVASLSGFATAHAAERLDTPAAWNIASRTPADSTPLRITETRYWQRRHSVLADSDWKRVKKVDCAGCHLDAERGTFQPGAIRVGGASTGKAT
jgi:cytochrome b